ncbi:MAG TPA: hypothetical protein VKQ36_06990 [Ktedonobacterales bacterium]|nr:hypothetical protein [Ktedonobacterales bacterium]
METLPRIPADFNDLGSADPNVIPLGSAESYGLQGKPLRDGLSAIFYEAGELGACGMLRAKRLPGVVLWEAVIDPATIRPIDADAPTSALSDSHR